MANIIPYDDTPIVDEEAMAEKHFKLVEHLKKSLYIGQAGFIKAGQYLTEIREEETYKYEDSQKETTWKEFCLRPDLPLNGSTGESRVRTSQKLMTVWKTIASRPDVDKDLLSEVGYTKLAVVAGVMNRDSNAQLDDWLTKAKELTVQDLQAEASDGGKTLAEVNECKHESYTKLDRWRCDDCKKILTEEPDGQ